MGRKRNPIPAYLHHKKSDTAFVRIRTPDGLRRDITLGKYGSAASKDEYARIIAELKVSALEQPSVVSVGKKLTVMQLTLAFLRHAKTHYRHPDGSPSHEISHFKSLFNTLCKLYGKRPATEFGPLALKAVRQKLIEAKLSRNHINRQIGRLKRAFKWAASEELIPVEIFQALSTVTGLQRNRTEAEERVPVKPVEDAIVEATAKELPPTLRAMVELQRLTGMRPGDVCLLRPCDLDMSEKKLWVYRPSAHKMSYRGLERVIPFGPKAIMLVKPFLKDLAAEEFVFSPRRNKDERAAILRARRKTKVQPSQISRRKPLDTLIKMPRECYSVSDYGNAIKRAAKKAGVSPWAPNQLRHTFGTEVRRQFGLEAAQVLLGHTRADVTQTYAERNQKLAFEVAGKIG